MAPEHIEYMLVGAFIVIGVPLVETIGKLALQGLAYVFIVCVDAIPDMSA